MKVNMFGENNFYGVTGSDIGMILFALACLACISNVWNQITHTFLGHTKDEIKSFTNPITPFGLGDH